MARTVLLADDSVTAQNMGRRIMTDAGYEVITVNNGSAALKKIHESRPDLIVLDVYMPGYGGLEVCQRLKESEATMKIPVLLTVGKMEPFKADEAKRVRADGHIVKPFDASELLSALTKLEDKIVPSENGRGRRGKAETKKSRIAAADPVASFADAQTEQIAYLARAKQRRQTDEVPEDSDSAFAQPPAEPTPVIAEGVRPAQIAGISEEQSFEPAETVNPHAEHEDAVTFAAGPIYEPELKASARTEKSAPEFDIQPEAEVQLEPAADLTAPLAESVPAAPPDLRTPVSEITVTETIAALETEPGLVSGGASSNFSSVAPLAAQPEPAQRWIAETVVPTSEESGHSLEEEMRQANAANEPTPNEAQPSANSATAPEPSLETEWQPQSFPETDSASGAAFAAAASASESFAPTNAVADSRSDSEPPSGSESSAAWDNWQRIRDTVITERATEAIAESAAALADAAVSSQNNAPVSEAAADAPASQPASGTDALASIVDRVLSELKPRLLAEIAKQLANDKK